MMSQNDLCPSCRQIAGKLISSKILGYNGEFDNQLNATFSRVDSRKCSGCDKIFSSMVYYEQPEDKKKSPEVKRISCSNRSPSWITKPDQPDPLIMKYFRLTLASQKRFSDNNSLNLTRIGLNDSTDLVNNDLKNDQGGNVAVQESESEERMDFETKSESNPFDSDDYEDDEEMKELNPVHSTMISTHCGGQDIGLFEDESFSEMDEYNANCDTIAYTIDAESIESEKSEESVSARQNSTKNTASKQSECQQQMETEFNAPIAQNDRKEFNFASTNETNVIDEGTLKSTSDEKSNITDRNQSKGENGSIFDDLANPIYCSDTNQIVSADEINAKIKENFIIDKSKARPYVCLLAHDCPRSYVSVDRMRDHLFSQLFFVNCIVCKRKFNHLFNLKRHLKICKEEPKELVLERMDAKFVEHGGSKTTETSSNDWPVSTSGSQDIQNPPAIGPTEIGAVTIGNKLAISNSETFRDEKSVGYSELPFVEKIYNDAHNIEKFDQRSSKDKNGMNKKETKFDNWNHPTYCNETRQRVSSDEINAKIKNNYTVDKKRKRPYICQIEHICYRFFTNLTNVKDHIFSHFFFFTCVKCGLELNYPPTLKRHLKSCQEKQQPNESSSRGKRSISDEFYASNERASKMSKLSSNPSTHHVALDKEFIKSVENLMKESKEIIVTKHNRSANTIPSKSINSPSHETKTDSLNMVDEPSKMQSDENAHYDGEMKTKLTRKSTDSSKIYRCPYCEYQCKPGGKTVILTHLNGRKLKGKVMAPACTVRKELKPANPETGLFERLEPILV